MCRVVISGFYGFDNAGDEAILQSMISELRKARADINIVVLSADPEMTARRYNVEAVDRSNIVKIYTAIKNSNALISGGGSLLQDTTSLSSMWYYSGIIMLAFILKRPVFAYAQGIGPVTNGFNIKLLKYIMKKADGVSVRDKKSLQELKRIGVERNVSLTVDPAFLIDSIPKGAALKLLSEENGGNELIRPKIGFSVRRWKGGVDISAIIAQVADRASKELNADIVLFPLHYHKDLDLAEEIAEKMNEPAVIVRKNYASEELMGIYGVMDLNVSVRFHGLVFSITNGVPVVAISYDPKIDSLMESINMKSVGKYKEINSNLIYSEIKKQWDNKSEVKTRLTKMRDELKTLANAGVEEMTNWIIKSTKENV